MTEHSPDEFDITVPHSARIWNYWLGGKDHFAVDRDAGDKYREAYPAIVDTARSLRAFLDRAIRFLAGEAGIRQIIDVGTGLPVPGSNTHEIAQRIAPESRIVYVDNDPFILAHARALLTSSPEGSCDYIDTDMRATATVLDAAARTLDLSQPVALLFMGVLGHVTDYQQAGSVVQDLLAALPPGSYLALADSVRSTREHGQAEQEYADTGAVPYALRDPAEIAGYFDGLTLAEPGLVYVRDWRPDPSLTPAAAVDTMAAVGRKG